MSDTSSSFFTVVLVFCDVKSCTHVQFDESIVFNVDTLSDGQYCHTKKENSKILSFSQCLRDYS